MPAAQRALRPVGGGTRGLVGGGSALDCTGLAGVRIYEPGALTLVAGAGTLLAEVEALLAGQRQRLAFDVPDMRGLLGRGGVSTLGGVVAANAAGPRRVQVGACRDHVLGLRLVDGRGDAIQMGGRVMKNVTGLDLAKLVCGSQGRLGVITEVALKLQALPEAEVTLQGAGRDLVAGLALLRAALASPYDVSGAAYAEGAACLRIEGMAGSVAYRAAAVQALLGGDWQVLAGDASRDLWRGLRDVSDFAGRPGAVWRLSVKPSDGAGVAQALAGVAHRMIHDWGGGLVWVLVDAPGGAADLLRGLVAGRGHATLIRALPGMAHVPVFQPEPPGVAALTRGIVAQFDPRGIFATGGPI